MKKLFLLLFFVLINLFFLNESCFYDDFFFVEKEYRLQNQEKRNSFKKKSISFFDNAFEKGFSFLVILIIIAIIYDYYRFYKVFNKKN